MVLLNHNDAVSGLAGAVAVLINSDGGAVARMGPDEVRRQVADAFAAHGIAADIIAADGGEIGGRARARLAAAARGSLAALVVGGGDGTINAVAQELAGAEVPLGILPLGTLNHFARDLGLPLDLAAAVATIARGHTVAVDLGEVNGRVFVNNSSIGLYPAMVRDRDRQRREGRRHKLLAMALAFIHVLRRPPVRRLRIAGEGWITARKVPFAFVGNNLYGTAFTTLGRRAKLTGGELCLFTASPHGIFGVLRLLLRAALGRLDQTRDFTWHQLRALTIDSRRRHLRVSLDGEVASLRPPLHYRVRPRALLVFAPPPAKDGR